MKWYWIIIWMKFNIEDKYRYLSKLNEKIYEYDSLRFFKCEYSILIYIVVKCVYYTDISIVKFTTIYINKYCIDHLNFYIQYFIADIWRR